MKFDPSEDRRSGPQNNRPDDSRLESSSPWSSFSAPKQAHSRDLPNLSGSKLTIAFRASTSLLSKVPRIQAALSAAGCEVNLVEIPEGTEEFDIGTLVNVNGKRFNRCLVLTDNTLNRFLNGNAPGHFKYSLDSLLDDELRAYMERDPAFKAQKNKLTAIPKSHEQAVENLMTHHHMFARLLEEAMQTDTPDHIYVVPHLLLHHEPFIQNINFILTETGRSLAWELKDAEAELDESDYQALLSRNEEYQRMLKAFERAIFDSIAVRDDSQGPVNTKIPDELAELIEKRMGFPRLVQPHDSIVKSLLMMGYEEDRITVVNCSRGDMTDEHFAKGTNAWVIGDRHAFKYGNISHANNLTEIIERNSHLTRLRLPLVEFFGDLDEAGLIKVDDDSFHDTIALACAKRLARDIAAAQ